MKHLQETAVGWFRDPRPTAARVPPPRYTLVYDDACGFCTAAARWIERRSRKPVDLIGLSALPSRRTFLETLTAAQLGASAHFVTLVGGEYHGSEAITRALRLWRWGFLVTPLDWPGLRALRAAGYQLVARNRRRLSRLVRR